jgi:hypothetical protein
VRRLETPLSASEGHAFHGPHVDQHAGSAPERVRWYPFTHVVERPRVLRWTCECRLTVYYLLAGGGRAWVRRSRRRALLAEAEIAESDHMKYRDAERLWVQILLGRAQ